MGNIVREERLFEQTKRGVRYCGARFVDALNTSTALLNIRVSLSGSKPERTVLTDGRTHTHNIPVCASLHAPRADTEAHSGTKSKHTVRNDQTLHH